MRSSGHQASRDVGLAPTVTRASTRTAAPAQTAIRPTTVTPAYDVETSTVSTASEDSHAGIAPAKTASDRPVPTRPKAAGEPHPRPPPADPTRRPQPPPAEGPHDGHHAQPGHDQPVRGELVGRVAAQ